MTQEIRIKRNTCFCFARMVLLAIGIATSAAQVEIVAQSKRTPGAPKYSWQASYAKATPQGDLEWVPQPFEFKVGKSVRYIDYESGDDSNTGQSKNSAWKHHPWDEKAIGVAAASVGIHTYVFKGGTTYRGSLTVKESGAADNPVRLTVDPSWGKGEAVISGSVAITGGWTKGADHRDIPGPENVWYRDLDFTPRTLWMVSEGAITRLPLARMPNWKISDPEDIKSEWCRILPMLPIISR
jgi:hypothetical protein